MSCNRCRNYPCMCLVPSAPAPFYAGGQDVQENHVQRIYQAQYAVGVLVTSQWNIPLVGGATILKIPGIINFPVGEYLHNESYGYFKVIAFSLENEEITVENPGLSGNSAVGTPVAACTTFSAGPAPCCEDTSQSGVYVAVSFTAPVVDACIDITVTSEEGLIAGNLASIGTGVYRISQVKADKIITICNEGEGILPGSPVIATNPITGEFQYPIQSISVNGCSQDAVVSGKVLVCVNGNSAPLSTIANGILTVVDNVNGKAGFSTALPSVVAGLSTTVDGLVTTVTGLQAEAVIVDNRITNIIGKGVKSLSLPKVGVTLSSSNVEVLSNQANFSISNNSTIRGMNVMYTVTLRLFGSVSGGNTNRLKFTLDIGQSVDGGATFTSLTNMNQIFFQMIDDDPANNPYDMERVWTELVRLEPLGDPANDYPNSLSRIFQGVLTWYDTVPGSGVSSAGYVVDQFDVQVCAIGVLI